MVESCMRGQIYIVTDRPVAPPFGSETWGNRWGIIVSNNVNNKYSNVVEVVYLTTSKRKLNKPLPTHVQIQSENKTAVALCEQIISVDKHRLSELRGTVTKEELQQIDQALLISLGVTNTPYPNALFQKWENYVNKYNLMGADTDEIVSLRQDRDLYKTVYTQTLDELNRSKQIIDGLMKANDASLIQN